MLNYSKFNWDYLYHKIKEKGYTVTWYSKNKLGKSENYLAGVKGTGYTPNDNAIVFMIKDLELDEDALFEREPKEKKTEDGEMSPREFWYNYSTHNTGGTFDDAVKAAASAISDEDVDDVCEPDDSDVVDSAANQTSISEKLDRIIELLEMIEDKDFFYALNDRIDKLEKVINEKQTPFERLLRVMVGD